MIAGHNVTSIVLDWQTRLSSLLGGLKSQIKPRSCLRHEMRRSVLFGLGAHISASKLLREFAILRAGSDIDNDDPDTRSTPPTPW